MASAHFVAKLDENRRTIDSAKNLHASGVWDISQEDAARLVGGRLYLHKTKSKQAFHGGTVVAFKIVETTYAHANRIEFEYVMDANVKDQAWPKNSKPRDWWSGVID